MAPLIRKATGQLAKTDRVDAATLASFARTIRPAVRSIKDADTRDLDDLVTRRRQLVDMRVQETLRLGTASKIRKKSLTAHITWLDNRITGGTGGERSSVGFVSPARIGDRVRSAHRLVGVGESRA